MFIRCNRIKNQLKAKRIFYILKYAYTLWNNKLNYG